MRPGDKILFFLFFSAWMFFEENKSKIVQGSGGVVDFSSLFDNAINQKDSFIPFQDSKVSIFWFYFLGCMQLKAALAAFNFQDTKINQAKLT